MLAIASLSFILSILDGARAAAIDESYAERSYRDTSRWQTRADCQPFTSTFPPSDVKSDSFTTFLSEAPFVAISPPGTYSTPGSGLQMFLKKPEGQLTTQGHVNSVVGQGATINSTFTMLYVPYISVLPRKFLMRIIPQIRKSHDGNIRSLSGRLCHSWYYDMYVHCINTNQACLTMMQRTDTTKLTSKSSAVTLITGRRTYMRQVLQINNRSGASSGRRRVSDRDLSTTSTTTPLIGLQTEFSGLSMTKWFAL